jgi:anti-sigma-K factor RskA
MTSEADRMSRAGSYVLGLMNDTDRERAERDLETDAEFRDDVVRIGERLHLIDLTPPLEQDAADRWRLLAQRIGEMPHMRAGIGAPAETLEAHKPTPIGRGLHAVPSRRAAALAIALIAAFAAGYLAARWRG